MRTTVRKFVMALNYHCDESVATIIHNLLVLWKVRDALHYPANVSTRTLSYHVGATARHSGQASYIFSSGLYG